MRATKGADAREEKRKGEFEGGGEKKPLLLTKRLERNLMWGGVGGIRMRKVYSWSAFFFLGPGIKKERNFSPKSAAEKRRRTNRTCCPLERFEIVAPGETWKAREGRQGECRGKIRLSQGYEQKTWHAEGEKRRAGEPNGAGGEA